MKKEFSISLIVSIVMGAVAAAIGGIVSSANTSYPEIVITNVIGGLLVGVITFFAFFFEFKVIRKYYPETKIESFKLARTISLSVIVFGYIVSIGAYAGFLIPTSIGNLNIVYATMAPFIADIIMLSVNALALFFVAVYSFNYNKAILLEKNEENTKIAKQVESTNNRTMSVTDELREYKKLLDEGVITQEEFDEKKRELLKK